MQTNVYWTDNGDGSAEFTVAIPDDEDHKFSAVADPATLSALVEYEETLSWRGVIRVKEPPQEVFRALASSDEMTEFLEAHGLDTVRREKR